MMGQLGGLVTLLEARRVREHQGKVDDSTDDDDSGGDAPRKTGEMRLAALGCQCVAVNGVGDERPRRFPLGRPMRPASTDANTRRSEAILAGLPAHVMDELVNDLAEAVVAILLDRESAETSDSDNESSHLRQIQ